MSARLGTAALAVGALALFYVIFLSGSGAPDLQPVSRPLADERGANGYAAAHAALARAGVPAQSWRESFATLPAAKGAAPTGNLLLVTLPGERGIRTEELAGLDRWLRAGNTLLVAAPLADTAAWDAPAFNAAASADLRALTGLSFAPPAPGRAVARPQARLPPFPQSREVRAAPSGGAHPLFDGVTQLGSTAAAPSSKWQLRLGYDQFALELARDSASGAGVLWLRRYGAGAIYLLGYSNALTNREIMRAGNARLLSNLIALSVAPQGQVLFDDGHQGLSASYDPRKFFADRRLHATVLILLASWLIWVLGSTRLRAPLAADATPREEDLILASGSFLARVVEAPEAASRMLQHFARRVGLRAGRGAPEAVPQFDELLDWLARQPRIGAADCDALRSHHFDAQSGRRRSLRELHNLLHRMDQSTL